MNATNRIKKNHILVCLIIGISFFWTGSGYISWLYNLMDIIAAKSIEFNVDILTEVYGYIMQAIGILIMVLIIRHTNIEEKNRCSLFIFVTILEMLTMFPATLSSSFVITLISGYLMNLLIGCIGALFLLMLSELVPEGRRGIVFGMGYSIGSIGSWILSLIGNGNFLKCDTVLAVYLLLMAITICMLLVTDVEAHIIIKPATQQDYNKKLILITGISILLLCATKGIGFYFPMTDISNGTVSLELSRAFYAIGLIIAGLLNDYRRSFGGIACIAALIIPFVLLSMTAFPEYSAYIWIINYIFIAFYNVFRILIFTDLADKTPFGLYLAPLGLMWGRIGDAIGSEIGITFASRPLALVILGAVMFIITVVIALHVFQKIYSNNSSYEKEEVTLSLNDKISNFAIYHDLSTREKEVLPLILNGNTNVEISDLLFVSENTVKFHVRNILKKTGSANRQELVKNFQTY